MKFLASFNGHEQQVQETLFLGHHCGTGSRQNNLSKPNYHLWDYVINKTTTVLVLRAKLKSMPSSSSELFWIVNEGLFNMCFLFGLCNLHILHYRKHCNRLTVTLTVWLAIIIKIPLFFYRMICQLWQLRAVSQCSRYLYHLIDACLYYQSWDKTQAQQLQSLVTDKALRTTRHSHRSLS